MKFSEFYKDAQRELTSTFVSMYAKGRPEYANHLRWLFETEEKEKLVQEPVFQSIFPWEPYSQKMSELTDLLGEDYIAALKDGKVVKYGNTDEIVNKESLEEIYDMNIDVKNVDGRKICIYF